VMSRTDGGAVDKDASVGLRGRAGDRDLGVAVVPAEESVEDGGREVAEYGVGPQALIAARKRPLSGTFGCPTA
jgi:hypothetical protein